MYFSVVHVKVALNYEVELGILTVCNEFQNPLYL